MTEKLIRNYGDFQVGDILKSDTNLVWCNENLQSIRYGTRPGTSKIKYGETVSVLEKPPSYHFKVMPFSAAACLWISFYEDDFIKCEF